MYAYARACVRVHVHVYGCVRVQGCVLHRREGKEVRMEVGEGVMGWMESVSKHSSQVQIGMDRADGEAAVAAKSVLPTWAPALVVPDLNLHRTLI